MIEVYKIMRGMDRVSREQLFPSVEVQSGGGQSFRVRGRRFRGNLRILFSLRGCWESGMCCLGR